MRHLLLLFCLMNLVQPCLFAQELSIRGAVVDSITGSPLQGVSVLIEGTSNGSSSNIEGKYELTVPRGDMVLVFSYVGYQTKKIPIAGRREINVALASDGASLDEVVVVGYGQQRRASITASVVTVSNEEVKSIPTANAVSGLAGRLPGLRVTQRTGEPGAYATSFDIRGFGAPLVVIDGVVRDGGSFSRLDPNDIESISVLKDASAAVYGVQAANGVILVTTRKGYSGKPQITYTANVEWQQVTNAPEVGNAYQFAVLTTENEINGGRLPGETTYSPEDIEKFRNGTYPSTDWYDVVAREYAGMQRHSLNVTGGGERIKYYTSLGYLSEDGLWKSGDLNYQRYNLRSNVSGQITDDLQAELFIDGVLENKNEPGEAAWNVFKFTWMNIPTFPVYANNNPEYLQDMTYPWHPLAMTTAAIGGYTKTRTKFFQSSLTLNYNIPFIDGMSAKLMGSFYNQASFTKAWRKKYELYDFDQLIDTYVLRGIQNNPSTLAGDFRPLERVSVLGQLTYSNIFNDAHHVNATLVFEERHEKNDNLWAQKQFAIDVDQFFAGISENQQVNSSGIYENANQNVVARLNYDYLSRYLLEAGFNYGGSSKFPKGKRWGFFPFISMGWRLSDEPFIKQRLPFLSDFKIRGSWGQMGDDGAAAFQFLTGYNYPSGNYIFDNEVISGLGFRGMPNPNITWYTVTTKNLGVDISLQKGLLSASVDIFQRDRSGLLATRLLTIPGTVGAELPQENLNKDIRRGIEVVLGHTNTIGELQYNVSANFTYTRGRPTKLERNVDGNSYLNWRNNPLNRWDNMTWGYNITGQFQSYEEIYASPVQDGQGNRTLRPGDFKYEDKNKDGILSNLDEVPIARSHIPEINYGLNLSASWKKFDVNALFQGAANFNFQYIEQLRAPLPWGRNSLTMFMDRWHHEDIYDANSPWVPGRYPATNYPASNNWNSQFWWPDASYLRLKHVELGYTIGPLRKAGDMQVRVFATGFNLATWTKVKYVDPEKDPETYNYLYPLMRIYNFGINVTF
ncbi:SusC/RagA family TonB-linked outer membrane protein [Parapedobacter defluvii]|nr:TonB-dependent receptor [Parapedobacter defluvii]